jgi:hypothetical protein
MTLIIFFYFFKLIKSIFKKVDKKPTTIKIVLWFILKISIIVIFVYDFDIILLLIENDILNFYELIVLLVRNDNTPLTLEVDSNLIEVVHLLDKYEQENINIPYERPYRNIKLMVKLLIRDFKIL